MKVFGLIIRILIIVAVIAVGVMVYQTCSGAALVQKIDKTMPDKAEAPFQVVTRTRVYLARIATKNEDGSVTMDDWYSKDGKEWVFNEKPFTLMPLLHPVIGKRQ